MTATHDFPTLPPTAMQAADAWARAIADSTAALRGLHEATRSYAAAKIALSQIELAHRRILEGDTYPSERARDAAYLLNLDQDDNYRHLSAQLRTARLAIDAYTVTRDDATRRCALYSKLIDLYIAGAATEMGHLPGVASLSMSITRTPTQNGACTRSKGKPSPDRPSSPPSPTPDSHA